MKKLTPQKICKKILAVLFLKNKTKDKQTRNRNARQSTLQFTMPLQFKTWLVLNLKAYTVADGDLKHS